MLCSKWRVLMCLCEIFCVTSCAMRIFEIDLATFSVICFSFEIKKNRIHQRINDNLYNLTARSHAQKDISSETFDRATFFIILDSTHTLLTSFHAYSKRNEKIYGNCAKSEFASSDSPVKQAWGV